MDKLLLSMKHQTVAICLIVQLSLYYLEVFPDIDSLVIWCQRSDMRYHRGSRTLEQCPIHRHSTLTSIQLHGSTFRYVFADTESLVIWSQRSHTWSKLRGITGDPEPWINAQYTYTIPLRQSSSMENTFRYGVTYHPEQDMLAWGDYMHGQIMVQRLSSSLAGRSNDIDELLYIPGASIGAIALDWVAGNVYFCELNAPFIGVQTWNTRKPNTYKIMFSSDIEEPEGLAVDPYEGYLFWSNHISSGKIERSKTDGSDRQAIRSSSIERPYGITLDLRDKRLYYVDRDWGGQLWIMDYDGQNDRMLHQGSGNRNYFGVGILQDYIFVTNGEGLSVDIHRRSGSYVRTVDIDASVYHIVALDYDVTPTDHDCETLGCDQICLSRGEERGVCTCAEGFFLSSDGKTCAESTHFLVYATQQSVIVSEATIDVLKPNEISLKSRMLTETAEEARAVAGHYRKRKVFYSDVETDMIHSCTTDGTAWRDITANARYVEGIAVDWRSDIVFWSDKELQYIMAAKLSGHLHRRHVTNTGEALDLVVDSVNDRLLWVITSGSIEAVDLDGSNRRTLMSSSSNGYRDLVADPVTRRLYWTNLGVIETSDLNGNNKFTLDMRSSSLFGLTLNGANFVYTTPNFNELKFWNNNTDSYVTDVTNIWIGEETNTNMRHYDVTSLNSYLQPDSRGSCTRDNGGCEQLCLQGGNSHTCACAIGYSLASNDRSICHTDLIDDGFLLFVDPYHRQLYQMKANESSSRSLPVHGIPVPEMEFPMSVDYDLAGRRVFWVDTVDNVIKSANLDGSDSKTIKSFSTGETPMKLALDSRERYVFYTRDSSSDIYRMKMDGSKHTRFLAPTENPTSLAIDYENGYLYWSHTSAGEVWRASVTSSSDKQLVSNQISRPGALAFSTSEMKLFIADNSYGIYSIDTNNTLTEEHRASAEFMALAVTDDYFFYSTWTGKSIMAVNRRSFWDERYGEEWFARVVDIKMVTGLLPYIPPVASKTPDDNNWIIYAAAAAAAVLFFLALLLFFCCCCKRRRKKQPPSESSSGGFDSVNDGEFDLYTSAGLAERGGMSSRRPQPPTPDNVQGNGSDSPPFSSIDRLNSIEDSRSTTELIRQTSSNSFGNGDSSLIPPSPSPLNGVSVMPDAPPPVDRRFTRKNKKTGRKSKTPVEARVSTGNTNDFKIQNDKKVATVIMRLTGRLRNKLSSANFKDPEPRPKIPSRFENDKNNPDEPHDLSNNPDFGSHKPHERPERTKGDIPPSLHPQPRGWAPASNMVPRTIIPTSWGKAKGLAAQKK